MSEENGNARSAPKTPLSPVNQDNTKVNSDCGSLENYIGVVFAKFNMDDRKVQLILTNVCTCIVTKMIFITYEKSNL